jgi:hypothetical protein
MTPAQRPSSPMAPSTLHARPCASAHPCATDSTVAPTLAPSATRGDLAFPLLLALASAFASRREPTPVPVLSHPPIQSA